MSQPSARDAHAFDPELIALCQDCSTVAEIIERLGLRFIGWHDWCGTDNPGIPLFVLDGLSEVVEASVEEAA